MPSNKTGNQEPRIAIEPKRVNTDGTDAFELTRTYGFTLDEWQRRVLDAWLARDRRDMFASMACGLSVPRQNGKNAILEARELYGLTVIGEQVLHTAHRVDTARKSFLRLACFFENPANIDLVEMVVSIRKTNGQESITLSNGGSIEFSSRINGGGRGATYDMVVFDEAQWLTDEQIESVMSTMAAAPLGNRQIIYTGTPPNPSDPGTIFRKRRNDALNGKSKNMCWHEWSVEEIGDISDRSRWYDANPGLGIRLDEDFTEQEYETLSSDGFARERLGWWSDESGGNPALNKACWLKGVVDKAPEPSDDEKTAYGVKFTPDGQYYALSAAVKKPGSKTLVECLYYKPIVSGIGWLADWLLKRKQTCALLAIDGRSNTAALEQRLKEGKFPPRAIHVMNSNEVSSAASMLKDAVDEEEVIHAEQPTLDKSAISAQKREIGKNGGWGFGDGVECCAPIESVSLAYWAVMTTKRRPGRKSKLL